MIRITFNHKNGKFFVIMATIILARQQFLYSIESQKTSMSYR
jgi:hypothetical protein